MRTPKLEEEEILIPQKSTDLILSGKEIADEFAREMQMFTPESYKNLIRELENLKENPGDAQTSIVTVITSLLECN